MTIRNERPAPIAAATPAAPLMVAAMTVALAATIALGLSVWAVPGLF